VKRRPLNLLTALSLLLWVAASGLWVQSHARPIGWRPGQLPATWEVRSVGGTLFVERTTRELRQRS
jgi:hypothetical protein